MKTPLTVLAILNYDRLGCDTTSRGNWFPKFRDKISGFVKDKRGFIHGPWNFTDEGKTYIPTVRNQFSNDARPEDRNIRIHPCENI